MHLALGQQDGAFGTPGKCDEAEGKAIGKFAQQFALALAGAAAIAGNHGKLFVIEFERIGEFEGFANERGVVKLLAQMELGESIPEELYRTIAEIIAFAWNLKGKFPQGHDPQTPRVEKDVTERGDDY